MAWQSEKGLIGINYIIGFGYDFVRISVSISLGCKFRIYKDADMNLLCFTVRSMKIVWGFYFDFVGLCWWGLPPPKNPRPLLGGGVRAERH